MKKFISVLLVIFMLSALCIQISAYKPAADQTLTQLQEIPPMDHLISLELPTSSVYSKPGTNDALSEADIADVGDVRYGISLIGVAKSLQRPLSAASDGVWSNYNKGGKVLENGMWSNGCITWMTPADAYYNVKGQTEQDDSIYVSLLTYNFGKVMNLEAFGYFTNNWNAFPRAADIYVSNNASDWTLVGKYDGNQMRVEGKEFTSAAAESPKDSIDGTTSVNPLWSLAGNSAQYLRIAIVKGGGYDSAKNPDGTYDGYSSNTSSVSIAAREIVVFGTDPNPEVPPVFEPVVPADPTDPEDPTVTDPVQNETDKTPESTQRPADSTPATDTGTSESVPTGTGKDTGTKKDGCASSVTSGAAILTCALSLGAVVVTKKKRR